MANPLLDVNFLRELFSERKRETYARIISLTVDEKPKKMVEGRVTQGSINIDGNSSMRRSCSLTLVPSPEEKLDSFDWALSTKFKLEIGVKNDINPNYDKIIFFPQGTYVITNANISYSTGGGSLSIQGKDKMCLINGEVSGEIYGSVDFGTIEEEIVDKLGNKTKVIRDYEIEDIIRDSVHEYAKEPFHNIIIKDIPKYGLFLMKYSGNKPMYALLDAKTETPQNVIINANTPVYVVNESGALETFKISDDNIKRLSINALQQEDKSHFTKVRLEPNFGSLEYYIMAIEPGQSAGYKLTTLTYPRKADEKSSGLIAGVGDSLTSILDKIVSMLGDYEYFYNVEGQFVFQKKNKYIDTNWNDNQFDTTGMGNPYILTASLPNSWDFGDNELVNSYSDTPNLQNIKNDFSIWGTRTTTNGSELPIHLRYAIDRKPELYTTIKISQEEVEGYKKMWEFPKNMKTQEHITYASESYYDKTPEAERKDWIRVDWRELIYRMAKDYRKFNHWDAFELKIVEANGTRYPGGKTGYEPYYVDIEGFWRTLYDPDAQKGIERFAAKDTEDLKKELAEGKIQLKDIYVQKEIEFVPYSSYKRGEYNSISSAAYDGGIVLDKNSACEGIQKYFDEPSYDKNYLRTGEYAGLGIETNLRRQAYYDPSYMAKNKNVNWWLIDNDYQGKHMYYFVKSKGNKFSPYLYYTPYDRDAGIIIQSEVEEVNRYYSMNEFGAGYGYLFKTEEFLRLVAVVNIEKSRLEYFKNNFASFHKALKDWDIPQLPSDFSFNSIYKDEEGKLYIINQTDIDSIDYYEIDITSSGAVYKDNRQKVFKVFLQNVEYEVDSRATRAIGIEVGIIPWGHIDASYTNNSGIYTLQLDKELDEHFSNSRYKFWPKIVEHSLSDQSIYRGDYTVSNALDLQYSRVTELEEHVKDFYLLNSNLRDYYYYSSRDNFGDIYYADEEGKRTYKNTGTYFLTSSPITYYVKEEYYAREGEWNGYWNRQISESPETLTFWFDFLDSPNSPIGKYGTREIQNRSKATHEDQAKAIYYRDTLNIIYIGENPTADEQRLKYYVQDTYKCFTMPSSYDSYFVISNAGKSCKDVLDEYLYQYTYANESVNLSVVPIYHLEPGNYITVQNSGVLSGGKYQINSISIPLNYNSLMSINAIKVTDKLY